MVGHHPPRHSLHHRSIQIRSHGRPRPSGRVGLDVRPGSGPGRLPHPTPSWIFILPILAVLSFQPEQGIVGIERPNLRKELLGLMPKLMTVIFLDRFSTIPRNSYHLGKGKCPFKNSKESPDWLDERITTLPSIRIHHLIIHPCRSINNSNRGTEQAQRCRHVQEPEFLAAGHE